MSLNCFQATFFIRVTVSGAVSAKQSRSKEWVYGSNCRIRRNGYIDAMILTDPSLPRSSLGGFCYVAHGTLLRTPDRVSEGLAREI
jgi:hypothetical protein